ncbi:MAG: peptidoglycan editing factor PgeF [Actinomycetota bacterium]|nr:peptidoglycan editing factor PgeF [Actinomycetota bacterium]
MVSPKSLVTFDRIDAGRVHAVFTTRHGGYSQGIFASANLSFAVGDDATSVRSNRAAVAEALDISPAWTTVRQVHSASVYDGTPDPSGRGFLIPTEVAVPADRLPEADAIVTKMQRQPICVMSADCLPIFVASDGCLAVIHAGWRGLAAGVIERTIEALPRADATAWLGPSIGPCHFEVGKDVPAAFEASRPTAPRFDAERAGSLYFDLRAAARWVLSSFGVETPDVEPPCTFCDQRFFSYRRDGPMTGRQGLVAWID